MAFAATVTKTTNVGGWEDVAYGAFSGGAPTNGTIVTGLDSIDYCAVTGASAISASGGTITVTSALTSGYWEARGKRIS